MIHVIPDPNHSDHSTLVTAAPHQPTSSQMTLSNLGISTPLPATGPKSAAELKKAVEEEVARRTQKELNELMSLRAAAISEALKKLNIPLVCVYTSWDDAMRSMGSCYGPNIADYGLMFKNADDGTPFTYGFKVRSSNFNELLVEIDARRFKIVVCDKDGQNPRLEKLSDVLKNAGNLFSHSGVAEGTDLYDPTVDDGKIKLRIETIYAPMGDNPTPGEPLKKQFCITKYSYQATDGNARNLDLFSHCQGTTVSDDRSGVKRLQPEVWNAETGKNEAYWFEAEETGKCIKDLATETQEESAAAVARGKGMAVETGPPGWPRVPNIYYSIQVPLVQNKQATFSGYENCSLSGMSAENDDGPPPAFRSLGASDGPEDSPPKRLKTAEATGVRLSRGDHAGDALGVLSKDIKRAKGEPITITASIVVAIPGDAAPSEKSIQEIYGFVQKLQDIAGNPKHLFDKDAGLTTGASLDGNTAIQILEKGKPKAPIVGMVVG